MPKYIVNARRTLLSRVIVDAPSREAVMRWHERGTDERFDQKIDNESPLWELTEVLNSSDCNPVDLVVDSGGKVIPSPNTRRWAQVIEVRCDVSVGVFASREAAFKDAWDGFCSQFWEREFGTPVPETDENTTAERYEQLVVEYFDGVESESLIIVEIHNL